MRYTTREIKDFFDIECPKCNMIAKEVEYIFDNEEVIECPCCGYMRKTDKETDTTTETDGYGVFHAEFYNRPFVNVAFTKPLEKRDINNFLKTFNDSFIIKEKSYFYLFNPKEKAFKVLKGSNPKTFKSFLEDLDFEMKNGRYMEEIDPKNFIDF